MKTIDIQSFLDQPGLLIDVRSPAEFLHGHIPGAINLPLFSNDERAIIGICYKQKGHQEAILKGLEIVGPKMASYSALAKQLIGNNQAKIYCWRGGLRSHSISWLLQTIGLKTLTLHQGYKTFRRWVLKELALKRSFALIGGLTGAGKTDVLHELHKKGEQTIDLEDLARHRGSSYGFLALPQPSNEQFENVIAIHLQKMNPQLPIWIEDESRMIGKCKIPDALFIQMRSSPLFIIESPFQVRIEKLIKDYGSLSLFNLINATKKIERKLGKERSRLVIELLNKQNLEDAVQILLSYYDKLYRDSLNKRPTPFFTLTSEITSIEGRTEKLRQAYNHTNKINLNSLTFGSNYVQHTYR